MTLLEVKLANAAYIRKYETHTVAAYYNMAGDNYAIAVFLPSGIKLLHVLDPSFRDPKEACDTDIFKDALKSAIAKVMDEAEAEKTRYLETQGVTTVEASQPE